MVIEAPLNFCPDDNVIEFVFFISPCVWIQYPNGRARNVKNGQNILKYSFSIGSSFWAGLELCRNSEYDRQKSKFLRQENHSSEEFPEGKKFR